MVARVSAKKLIDGSAPRETLGARCRALRAPRSSARRANIYIFSQYVFFLTRVMDLAEKEGLLVIKFTAL